MEEEQIIQVQNNEDKMNQKLYQNEGLEVIE
jgi:hypothetical protein